MAEAHEAVAFQFTVGPDGFSFDMSYDVFKAFIYSGLRSWKLRCRRTLNSLHNSLYPGHPLRGIACCGIVYGLYAKGYDPSYKLIDWIDENIVRKYFRVSNSHAVACVIFGAGVYLVLIQMRQYSLRKIFSYHGWMYHEHGKPLGIVTKTWGTLAKLLVGSNPSLYSYQSVLPTLPVPILEETLERYLRTVRPLFTDQEYQRMEVLAEEFKQTVGRKLQRYLRIKWLISSNYVSDWWERFIYLSGRSPIMVNSNFYGMDSVYIHPTKNQTARAANVVCSIFNYRTEIDHETFKPLLIQKLIPLCSSQYERQFNTVRIPGKEIDKLVHYADSHHIAVHHRGRWYKVFMYYGNHILQPCELQVQLDEIIRDSTQPAPGEEHLAALTAGSRTPWAEMRQKYFRSGVNRSSLEAIEKAAFVVCLDEEDMQITPETSDEFDNCARAFIHGKAHDRWFDKSFNLIVSKNGIVGINVEHSWADAPVSGHMFEYILSEDLLQFGYDESGNTRGTPRFNALKPIKLRWSIPDECKLVIEQSLAEAEKIAQNIDLHIYVNNIYSKGFMKKAKLSPDAYVQMALQLAHYRDSGRFNLTYEASMTRLFREGRTETVRSCSIESSEWVKAMEDPNSTNSERVRLLRRACDHHQNQYRDAMTGKGIDRHLFCLYVLSKYLGIDSPFLQEVLMEPWKLSTSQTPTSYDDQRLKRLMKKNPEAVEKYKLDNIQNVASAGGGFGPVAADGYGVSYIIATDDILFFHISSNKSSPETDSKRFGQRIKTAMEDMKNLLENEKSDKIN